MRRSPLTKPSISSEGFIAPDPDVTAPTDRLPAPAFLASTLVVKGEVSADQDLIVEGRIDGSLSLPGHRITVGRKGRIKGDLTAKTIRVDGLVEGNLQGEEKILLGRSARARGNLTAPRVVLEDGCRFSGGVYTTAGWEPATE